MSEFLLRIQPCSQCGKAPEIFTSDRPRLHPSDILHLVIRCPTKDCNSADNGSAMHLEDLIEFWNVVQSKARLKKILG